MKTVIVDTESGSVLNVVAGLSLTPPTEGTVHYVEEDSVLVGPGYVRELSGSYLDPEAPPPLSFSDYQALIYNEASLEAVRKLASSDWMVLEANETGKAVDPQWSTYRAGVRSARDAYLSAILSCLTDQEILDLEPPLYPNPPAIFEIPS